jgi:CopG-like RHH_1 or ribbon-helix-helix domain, RHH_5
MAITKRPPAKKATNPEAVEKFVSGAPDSKKAPQEKKGLMRGKREQISHTIPPALLEKLDQLADSQGMTRAGLINLAISQYCQSQDKGV